MLDEELQDVRWFERAEIEAAARAEDSDDWGTPGDPGGPLRLPPEPRDRPPPDRRLARTD